MIRVGLFGDQLTELDIQITKYINGNLALIIRVLLDMLEDDNGFEAGDFLPYNNFETEDDIWVKRVYDLYDMVCSDLVRDYIKPKYEYLLYVILQWWEECTDNESELLPNKLDIALIDKIKAEERYWENDRNYILEIIVDYEEYYNFLFEDHDFLPSSVERMLTFYLRTPKLFETFYPGVDLNEYYEFMPKDLKERYDDINEKNQYNTYEDIELFEKLNEDILLCCERIQARNYYKNASENEMNDQIRDLLWALKYDVRDQTRQGTSAGGKQAGNVDLLIVNGNMPISLIEALKLDSVLEDYISLHIDKIYNYDTLGYECNYLIAYVKTKSFKAFWDRYLYFIKEYKYPYEKVDCCETDVRQYSEIKRAFVCLKRNGVNTKLYFLVIHIPD